MFRNYLKIALRNLWNERTFSALNITGLSVAFTAACLLFIYVFHELSYDRFHEDVGQIYQVWRNEQTPRGKESSDTFPVPFAPTFQEEVSGIAKVSRYLDDGKFVRYGDKTIGLDIKWVDADFLDIFSFEKLSGKDQPLESKNSIILTTESSKAIFNEENPVGKVIELQLEGKYVPFTVTALYDKAPENSSLEFSALVNFKDQPDSGYKDLMNRWDSRNHSVFVKLDENLDSKTLLSKTQGYVDKYYKSDIENARRDGANSFDDGSYVQLQLFNVADLNFMSQKDRVVSVSKTLEYVVLFIAFLIIFIASVNFINMSIGKGAKRMREVGMRKTLGASKSQLFMQLWLESLFVFVFSILIAGVLSFALYDSFKELFRTRATFDILLNPFVLFTLLLTILLVSLIAGGYPAMMISKSGTLQALKGTFEVSSKNRVRNFLMIAQFSISIILISGTLVLYNQINFLKTTDLGYDKEQVISIPLNSSQDPNKLIDKLRNELEKEPIIASLGGSSYNLGLGRDFSSSHSRMGFDHKGKEIKTNIINVDHYYPQALGIEIIHGRSFRKNYQADSLSLIINESMAAQFEEENPLDIVMILDETPFQVVGVVKDYHFEKMNKQIEPLTMFTHGNGDMYYAYARTNTTDLAQAYKKVESAWNTVEPNREFLGSYLDENIERTLQKEESIIKMITTGSVVAIIISCIGLFAMSILLVAQRRKEIGIRKVIGASVSNVTVLLTKDFVKLVLIAFLIAAPISYYFAQRWLENYSYHMDLSIWIFAAAGCIALAIAISTVGFRTIRAAVANPVDSLKSE